jgi:hypothetical protein
VPVRKGGGYFCYLWDDITTPDFALFQMCSYDDNTERSFEYADSVE